MGFGPLNKFVKDAGPSGILVVVVETLTDIPREIEEAHPLVNIEDLVRGLLLDKLCET